ncbi:nicotinamide N-methyltransferase [Misgurnus anguillicaudatus]|uniref:nicotinamide N-methyltransferase n=1 Tax=Misgurnus anguillicaudatus TaxID=75329 RepID=UPI003CCF22C6
MSECVSFTEGEFYDVHFDSRAYVKNFYSCPRGHSDEKDFLTFVLRSLSRVFSTGEHKGKLLIEVGSGPNIHSVLSACEHYDEIVLSDFADNNRREIEKWLINQEGCVDWTPILKHVCELDGKSPSDLEALLRQRVKKVLKCDVRLENPFYPHTLEPADCVITSLCLEAACKDIQAYRQALHGLTKLLRPGGLLVMIGVLGETFYKVNEQSFSCLKLSQRDIEEALRGAGFSIHEFNILPAEDPKSNSVSDFEAVFHLVANKSSELQTK